MDAVQDWAAYFLGDDHSSAAAAAATTLRTYTPYLRHVTNFLSLAQSFLITLVDRVSQKPDLATFALLLIIVLVSLKILDLLYQTLLFWLRLARRIAFWGAVAAAGVWLYTRGMQGATEDVGRWLGVWEDEYRYWRERERVARLANRGGAANGWF